MVVVDWLQYWIIPSAAHSKNIDLSNVLSETFYVKKKLKIFDFKDWAELVIV